MAAGICGDPVEPDGLAGEGVRYAGSVDNRAAVLEGSCGGEGLEVVHRFVAPSRGTIQVGLEAERGFVVHAMRACAESAEEVFCAGPEDGMRSVSVEEGEVLFVVVDAPLLVAEPTYHLDVTFVPTLVEGEACDLEGEKGRCDAGLFCEWEALTCAPNHPPTLSEVDAVLRYGGGGDARVRVEGADPDGNLAGLALRFLDEEGERVQVNGLGELYTPFDDSARQAVEFSWTRVLNGLASRYPDAVAVEVELVDGSGARSNTEVLAFAAPATAARGEGCDPDGWEVICGEEDLCQRWRGEAPFCEAQEPPVLTSAKAWRTEGGALVMVVDGSDPNGDVNGWFGSLLTESGQAVTAFPRRMREGVTGFDRFFGGESEIHGVSTWKGILGWFDDVVKVRVSLSDSGGNRSEAVEIPIEIPQGDLELGATCDEDLVATTCEVNLACGDGPDDSFVCMDRDEARRQKCDAAPTLRVGETIQGVLRGENLWTPSEECSPVSASLERHEGVDAVVRLEVDEPTETLRLTTDLPGTKGRHTLIHVLTACEGGEPVACNDDWMNGVAYSTLTMKNVLPGTYWVVVDTATGAAPFDLEAVAE
ncbi:MAG TPA: hypothetical protein VN033_09555 [Vulgatibacter sp.]|nr:hypothetical protein [Vulgatibacter sp.]